MPYCGLFSQFVRGKWSKRFYFVFVNYFYLLVILFMFYHFDKLSLLTYFFPMVRAQHVWLNWFFCNSVRLFPLVSCLLSVFGIPSLWKKTGDRLLWVSFFSRLVYFFNSEMNHWNNKSTNQLCVLERNVVHVLRNGLTPTLHHKFVILITCCSACIQLGDTCTVFVLQWVLCADAEVEVFAAEGPELSNFPHLTPGVGQNVFNYCIVWTAKLLDLVSVETVAEKCAIQPLI